MLDTRRLQVLDAVVSTGSVSGAASVLGYTPSAISQNITALERQTGTVLLEKAGRGVVPTQAGRLLATHAGVVLDRLREAEAALAALRAGQAGRLQLSTFATAGATLVPRALARFSAAHPGVQLDVNVAELDEVLNDLRGGRIDIAVVVEEGNAIERDATLAWTHLLDDPYRVVLPRDHSLASRRTIDLAGLAEEPWIATSSPACNSRMVVTEACEAVGITPRFGIQADEFATAMGFVNAGLGVALLPILALSSVPDGVRVRHIRGREPVRRVFAVTRQAVAEQPALTAMVAALGDSAREYVAGAR